MPDTRVNVTVEPLPGAGDDYKVETLRLGADDLGEPGDRRWNSVSTAVLRPGLGSVAFPLNEDEAIMAYPASLHLPDGCTYMLVTAEEARCVRAFRDGRISITPRVP